jgi:hypothetical protein
MKSVTTGSRAMIMRMGRDRFTIPEQVVWSLLDMSVPHGAHNRGLRMIVTV